MEPIKESHINVDKGFWAGIGRFFNVCISVRQFRVSFTFSNGKVFYIWIPTGFWVKRHLN